MQETPPPLHVEPPAQALSETSLAARLMNIFAVPGEVFDEVKASAHAVGNWLVPVLLGCVVGVAAVLIVLSQPAIRQQIREQQEKAMSKQMDKLVESGKITQQQADQQKEMAEKFMGPMMMKISGSFGVILGSFAWLFGVALALWLLGKLALRAQVGYLKAVEIVGLAGMIASLGKIVKLLLQVNFSSLTSSPSLALAVKEFNPQNPWHLVLASLNLFDLWEVALLALGLARLAQVPFARAALPVFGCWLAFYGAWISFITMVQRLFG